MAALIRAGSEDDLDAITAIYAHAVETGTASFELEPPSLEDMRHRRKLLVDAGYPYLVAELEGTVCGYAYAGPYRTRPAYRFSVENSVYIADHARRKGLGQALLKTLIAQCEARPYRQMIAIIGDSQHQASIALHSLLGFAMVGTIENVGWKHGRWLDTVIMQRALGDGAQSNPP